MTLAEMAAIPMFDQTLTLDEAESAEFTRLLDEFGSKYAL